jgi:PAN domain
MNNSKCICILTILWAFAFFSIFGMEAILAQDQFIEPNTDRPGNDYTNFDIEPKNPRGLWGPETDCQLSCQKDSKCQAWTYVKPGIQGPKPRCWLKNVIPAAHANNCCTSGVVTQEFEPNTDRPGKDYTSFNLQTPDSNACQTTCRNDQKCQAWTYVRPGIQGPQARCWLKNAIPAAHANNCCMSGVVNRPPILR